MVLIICPECKKKVSTSADACPHCGYKLYTSKGEPLYKAPKNFWVTPLGIAVAVLLFLIFILIVRDCACSTGSSDSNVPKVYDALDAYIEAQAFVKKHLKSPITAEFPSYHKVKNQIKYLGTNKYEVVAYVDSQNSFGAMIRTTFSCRITFVGGGQVRCENLTFDE